MSCFWLTVFCIHTKRQPQPAASPILWRKIKGSWSRRDPHEKYDKTLLNHLKILQLTFAFLHSLNEGISPFWSCFHHTDPPGNFGPSQLVSVVSHGPSTVRSIKGFCALSSNQYLQKTRGLTLGPSWLYTSFAENSICTQRKMFLNLSVAEGEKFSASHVHEN